MDWYYSTVNSIQLINEENLTRILFSDGYSTTVSSQQYFLGMDYQWIKVSDLKEMTLIQTVSGFVEIEKVEKNQLPENLYQIEVTPDHSFVLENGVIVHNAAQLAVAAVPVVGPFLVIGITAYMAYEAIKMGIRERNDWRRREQQDADDIRRQAEARQQAERQEAIRQEAEAKEKRKAANNAIMKARSTEILLEIEKEQQENRNANRLLEKVLREGSQNSLPAINGRTNFILNEYINLENDISNRINIYAYHHNHPWAWDCTVSDEGVINERYFRIKDTDIVSKEVFDKYGFLRREAGTSVISAQKIIFARLFEKHPFSNTPYGRKYTAHIIHDLGANNEDGLKDAINTYLFMKHFSEGVLQAIIGDLEGLLQMISHPIQTVEELASLLMNCDQFFSSLMNATKEFLENYPTLSKEEQDKKLGELTWLVGSAVVPNSKIGKAGVTVKQFSDAAVNLGRIAEFGKDIKLFHSLNPGPLSKRSSAWWGAKVKLDDRGLPQNGATVASTYRGGTYAEAVSTKEITLYRVYTNEGKYWGRYWSTEPPKGALQAKMDLSLLPSYRNEAIYYVEARVPVGQKFFIGITEAMRDETLHMNIAREMTGKTVAKSHLMGGGFQVFIDLNEKPKGWTFRPDFKVGEE